MIPLVLLKRNIEGLLSYLNYDYRNTPNESDTFLYRLLYGMKDGSYDFYQQAKSLFYKDNTDRRKILVSMEFPRDVKPIPMYVVREPSHLTNDKNFIGKNTGDFYPSDYTNENLVDYKTVNFDIMCVCDNFLTSVLMSEVMYALCVAGYETWNENFIAPSFSIEEIAMDNALIPIPMFIRDIKIFTSVRNDIPAVNQETLLNSMEFDLEGIY